MTQPSSDSVAELFWSHVAAVPARMRLTAHQLRLADIECRQCLEALIDASCKSSHSWDVIAAGVGPSAAHHQYPHSAAVSGIVGGSVAVDGAGSSSGGVAVSRLRLQQEANVIARLETAVSLAAEQRVDVARRALLELEALLETMSPVKTEVC